MKGRKKNTEAVSGFSSKITKLKFPKKVRLERSSKMQCGEKICDALKTQCGYWILNSERLKTVIPEQT